MRSWKKIILIGAVIVAILGIAVLAVVMVAGDVPDTPLANRSSQPEPSPSTLPSASISTSRVADALSPSPRSLASIPATPPAPLAASNPASRSEEFQTSVFDKIPDDRFEGMDTIQQAAFATIEEKFNAFYQEWLTSGKTNHEEWNEKLREFHQEMLLNFGPEQMDKLLQSAPPSPSPPGAP